MMLAPASAVVSVPDQVTLTRGMPMAVPFGAAAQTPEARAMRTYADELFAMMDVRSVGYSRKAHPNTLRVSFNSYDFAKLADNVLRDEVLGVKLVFLGPDGVAFDMTRPAAAWTSSRSNAARAIAAMPGVVSYSNSEGSVMYRVASADVRDELRGIVEDQPNGAQAIWLLHRTPAA